MYHKKAGEIRISMFTIRRSIKFMFASLLLIIFAWRVFITMDGLLSDKEDMLLAFPLAVIFPALLVCMLLLMPATETKEGLLMRVGTIVHLLLIIGIPSLALQLALGFPFVFLFVELFETRVPRVLRDKLTKLVLV